MKIRKSRTCNLVNTVASCKTKHSMPFGESKNTKHYVFLIQIKEKKMDLGPLLRHNSKYTRGINCDCCNKFINNSLRAK